MLVMIDNYDSFTYNLVQYFGELGQAVHVVRNDALSVAELDALSPAFLVISPGPGIPGDAGISVAAIRHFADRIPILGVCLGHQSIAQAFGAEIVPAKHIMHGKTSFIEHNQRELFAHLPSPFQATRYHSLAVSAELLPGCLEITAWTADQEIMGIRHRELPIQGVQFHPESILTQHGHALLQQFLQPS